MKTEQELKDALEDIFFDALTDKSNPPYYTDKVDPENDGYWQCKVYELCADELIKRGYGDVSEYKAEIEQLKAENDSLNKKISELEQDLIHADENVFYRECDVKLAEDKIKKQAQIDVLNKVKTLIFQKDNPYNVPFEEFISANVFCGYIDELIAEIEQ